MKVAVIPARGGSKRIPRKNIKDFCGRPMIAWSIIAAQKSGLFDHIIVSTEDAEIAQVAREWRAEAPFTRPADLADDHTGTPPVVAHAVDWMQAQGWDLEAVCCLYPASPFIHAEDVRKGLELLQSGGWAYAFTVTDFPAPIFRSFRQLPEGGVEMFFPEHALTRSQDLPEALHDAAQFYWGTPEAWRSGKPMFAPHTIPLRIPRWRVQDIDTEDDWVRATHLFRLLELHKG